MLSVRGLRAFRRSTLIRRQLCVPTPTQASFDTECVLRDTLEESKELRFGSQLEKFKQTFEKPVVDGFNTIQSIKKNLSNKQARWMMRTSKKGQRKKPKALTKRDHRNKWHEWETNFLKNTYETLEEPKRSSVIAGTGHKQNRLRERFLSAVTTGNKFQEVRDPATIDDVSLRRIADPGRPLLRAWKWEGTLEDGELALIIGEELQAMGFQADWKKWLDRTHAEQARESERNLWDDQLIRYTTKEKGILTENETVPGRPALLRPLINSTAPKKPTPCKIVRCSDQHPVAFETTHWPLDLDVYNPYNTRKVTMYVRLRMISLPATVRNRLLELSARYYDKNKDLIIIPSSKKRTMAANKQWCVSIFREMMREAWKIDLNFVPAKPDFLLPHQQVALELENIPILAEQKRLQSFESIMEAPNLTMFSFPYLPNLSEMRDSKEKEKVYLSRWETKQ